MKKLHLLPQNPIYYSRNARIPPSQSTTTLNPSTSLATPIPNPLLHPWTLSYSTNWHLKRNHAPLRVIQSIARQQLVHAIPCRLASISATISCSVCAHAKQRPSPHKPKQHSYKPSEYISSDTCGPINPPSLRGHLHFLSYIDAASRYLILFFLKDRREVGIIMPQFFKHLR